MVYDHYIYFSAPVQGIGWASHSEQEMQKPTKWNHNECICTQSKDTQNQTKQKKRRLERDEIRGIVGREGQLTQGFVM